MKSLRELFRIGYGPSSSHTMGPRAAAEQYKLRHPEAVRFCVTLYGSLAATGKGHLTDMAIKEVLGEHRTHIIWRPDVFLPFHPNGMKFEVEHSDGIVSDAWTVYSVGGGALAEENDEATTSHEVYELDHLNDIMDWCAQRGVDYWNYVEACEGPEIWTYLAEVWEVMKSAVERGLEHEGVLPGELHLQRKAPRYYIKAKGYGANLQSRGLVFSYALAVSEENAGGGQIVTAPTCGSCGVVPAVLYHIYKSRQISETRILHALATAGLIGNVAKTLASISGGGMCHGGRRCQLLLRREFGQCGVCSRNGIGTSPRHDLRPHLWFGADPVHRTQRPRRSTRTRRQHLCHLCRRHPPHFLRQGGHRHGQDRSRPAFTLS